mgnify:CR=1 FL=1
MKKCFLFMILSLLSHETFAQFSGLGSGTADDPYQITNGDDLFDMRNKPEAYYILMNDIDLTEWIAEDNPDQGWLPIPNFNGYFDGNNKTIRGLFINRPTTDNVGLFQTCKAKEIKNLMIMEPRIIGKDDVGTISGTLQQAYVHRVTIINPQVKGNDHVGGLSGSIAVINKYFDNVVLGGNIEGNLGVGGLYGNTLSSFGGHHYNVVGYGIVRCYSSANVKATKYAGGIVGRVKTHYYVVTNQYSGIKKEYIQSGGIHQCRFSGRVEAQTHAGAIVGDTYSDKYTGTASDCLDLTYNIFSGVVKAQGGANGMVGSYMNKTFGGTTYSYRNHNVCVLDSIIVTGATTGDPKRITTIEGTDNYASLKTIVSRTGEIVQVEDNEYNGTGYSYRNLLRKNTYVGWGFSFDSSWSMIDGETLPYNKNQTAPVKITAFVSGKNSIIRGTAEADGKLFVIVNGKVVEGVVKNNEWEVGLGTLIEGTEAQVSVQKEEMLPSILVSAKCVSQSEGGDIIDADPEVDAISIGEAAGCQDGEATASISLKNSQEVNSYSFDLLLPEGVTLEGYKHSERHQSQYCSVDYQKTAKTYHFEAISLSPSEHIADDNGLLWTLKMKVSDKVQEGEYIITLKNVNYRLPQSSTTIALAPVDGVLTVKKNLKGDVDGDGEVDVNDVQTTINIILKK